MSKKSKGFLPRKKGSAWLGFMRLPAWFGVWQHRRPRSPEMETCARSRFVCLGMRAGRPQSQAKADSTTTSFDREHKVHVNHHDHRPASSNPLLCFVKYHIISLPDHQYLTNPLPNPVFLLSYTLILPSTAHHVRQGRCTHSLKPPACCRAGAGTAAECHSPSRQLPAKRQCRPRPRRRWWRTALHGSDVGPTPRVITRKHYNNMLRPKADTP